MTDAAQADQLADCPAYTDPDMFDIDAAGQRLTFYPSGADRRQALFDLVASAERSLKLCFYIFAEDAVSTELRDALTDAAGRGVAVTLIIDRFGSDATDEFLQPLRDAGGTVHCFSPRWSFRYLIRNHQKMAIADDERALFGGFNIEDDYFAPPEANGWNDLAIRVEGSAVEGLVAWFAKIRAWTEDDSAHFRDIRKAVKSWDWSDGEARWLIGGPTRGLSTWAKCVSDDLARGRQLDMFMAYFSPSKKLLRRIGAIASRGEARLLMAGKSDNGATIGATRSLYHYLLHKGAAIWEFTPCKLHTKLIVLDDAVYLGSANFDMRSLYINLELMLRIEDKALADRMRDYVTHHAEASRRITSDLHQRRSGLLNRVRWNLSWFLVSVVDYTVSRRLNLGL